jgi:UDPglucose 6-dehydrogenase
MKIGVIGTGYVGLVVGAGFAHTGHDVVCADIDEEKIRGLKKGVVPIFEPGLDQLVEENLEAGRLDFTTDVAEAVRRSEIIFIAVGTPSDSDGAADLRQVLDVARQIGRAMDGRRIVITKSTVPVGTARKVREVVEAETDHPVHVCSNPEFLKEGAAVDDFMKPDRVVLGVDDEETGEILRDLFAPFVRTGNEILLMDVPSAEITKYAANAMLATRISFMNAVARLCVEAGADVDRVRLGVGSDRRIGPSFLFPGVGYGGSCFPKDVRALIRTSRELGVDASILEAVDALNERQKHTLLDWTVERFGEDLSGRAFAVWGLAFKPNTDDMREAPSLVSIRGLLERGARVAAHDPVAVDEARRVLGDGDRIRYTEVNYDALEGADALLIHTEWHPYRRPDFPRMRKALRQPVVFDGRNLYSVERMVELGFEYRSIGRPAVIGSPAGPASPGAAGGVIEPSAFPE